MNKEIEEKKYLILKDLLGELNTIEKQDLEQWLQAAEENRAFYNEIETIYKNATHPEGIKKEIIEKAWTKLSGKIEGEYPNAFQASRQKENTFFSIWKVAAILIFVISIASGVLYKLYSPLNRPEIVKVESPMGARTRVVLPDGSAVALNSGSQLEYPAKFEKNERRVKLTGEGFFEVTKNHSVPFIVETSKLNVKVYGTKFNICAYNNDPFIETTLISGSVSVTPKMSGKESLLVPGEKARYESLNNQIIISKVDAVSYSAWTEDEFCFDNASFDLVVRKMERRFNMKIILAPELSNKEHFTMTLKSDKIDKVLDILKATTPISYKFKNDTLWITAKR
ncbi:MAG: FecR domain-containing protein [Bacteroidota bacterium]|nr:FecR domain-containing protein [Bacteroidota bacterium]